MIKEFDFDQMVWRKSFDKVLENEEAMLVYFGDDDYMAISKQRKGMEYTYSGFYYNSTRGDFNRCKKAFEKYSPETMKRLSAWRQLI